MKGKFVCITQEQANEILDILNDDAEGEPVCYARSLGAENCRHCQIDRAAGYLFDGGLVERKYDGGD